MEEYVKILKQRVEQRWGREVTTPASIHALLLNIKSVTGDSLSLSTIKRLWGKVSWQPVPSETTREILSRYVGYEGWNAFCAAVDGRNSSDFIGKAVHAKQLAPGTTIILKWHPNRTCTLRFDGDNLFTVLSTENSKLIAGATFNATTIANGHPMIVDNLMLPGAAEPCGYIAGKTHGVTIVAVKQPVSD
ncbi:MAG: hypothetical protein MJZ74_04170 [Muribaculaceae bacterium]|nr:hypothetical protein [Muribaculaceae bacterium]